MFRFLPALVSVSAVALLAGAGPGAAQSGFGAPIVQSDRFSSAPAPAAPAAPTAPAAPPAAAAPASGAPPAAAAGTPATPGATPPATAAAPRPAPPVRPISLPANPNPSFDEGSLARLDDVILRYRAISGAGGWGTLPAGTRLQVGARGEAVERLRRRLALTGDLDAALATGAVFDAPLAAAVRKFQARHGLPTTGAVADRTLTELNVPVERRLVALTRSRDRLRGFEFGFGQRYVVVNIPAAAVEAVEDGRVERRHVAVVGRPDRASPQVETRITTVNLNPTWTVPTSLIEKDFIPKMQRDPTTLARYRIRVLDGQGREVPASAINWSGRQALNYTLRQDPGVGNSLGRVRLDMPNTEAVFMHDTPSQSLFAREQRFHSSGCVRVSNVRDLAAWLLEGQGGWDRARIDREINTLERRDIRLARAVPVAWVYLTGYVDGDGTVQFREDVYGFDKPDAAVATVVRPRRTAPPPAPEPVVAVAAPPAPAPVVAPAPEPQMPGLFDWWLNRQ